jgi:imidazolonepropionase-like amidohydrolase
MMKDRVRLLWLPVTAWMLTQAGLAQAHDADRPTVASNVETFAVPPKTAQVWSITSESGRHGTMSRWTTEDGVLWSRKSFLVRGLKTEMQQETRFDADGSIRMLRIRGSTPYGTADEDFTMSAAGYSFKTAVDHGSGKAGTALHYHPLNETIDSYIALSDALMKAPGNRLRIVPSGEARMSRLTALQISSGGETKQLTAYAVDGLGVSPLVIWVEGKTFFGTIGLYQILPDGWEGVGQALGIAQAEALASRNAELVTRLAPRMAKPLAFTNVRIFDADNGVFRDGMTVTVENGKIVQVGTSREITPPHASLVIDGRGKTLMPGLWDSHQHLFNDESGLLLLSQGIVNIRDAGNQIDELLARRQRIRDGKLLGPRIVASMLIDGKSPLAAQVGMNVETVAEAQQAVQRAKTLGFEGIKLYGSLDKSLVRPMVEEAHRLGIRVHGHIPHGMRPSEAVAAGYDELNHINFVMMEAMPDSVVERSNTNARFYGPALYGPKVRFDTPPMKTLLDTLSQKQIVVDPDISLYETSFVPDQGELAISYHPFSKMLPTAMRRTLSSISFAPTAEVDRKTMRQGYQRLFDLTAELFRRNIPVVAGTDGNGLELVREIELYHAAGVSPERAIQAATIVPAKAFGLGETTGSIKVGKDADIFLVSGDPRANLGALRNVEYVVRDGRLMRADALRQAAGFHDAGGR